MKEKTEPGVCHPDDLKAVADELRDQKGEIQKLRIAYEKLAVAKEPLLSVRDAAEELNTHIETIRRMARDGRLKPVQGRYGKGFRLKFERHEINRAKALV